MAQYYGIERSDKYLAHYGIRGMKWGVRKAIERGDRAAVARHYQKAKNKLAKLTDSANTGRGIAARRVASGAASSALLSGLGTYALNRASGASPLQAGKTAGLAALAGGAGGAVLNAGKATPLEKQRARMKRDAWKREMDATFKGIRKTNAHKSTKQRASFSAAKKAGDQLAAAEKARDKSFLGRHGFGKTQRAVNEARRNANEVFDNYYNGLNKKQRAKLRRRWVD